MIIVLNGTKRCRKPIFQLLCSSTILAVEKIAPQSIDPLFLDLSPCEPRPSTRYVEQLNIINHLFMFWDKVREIAVIGFHITYRLLLRSPRQLQRISAIANSLSYKLHIVHKNQTRVERNNRHLRVSCTWKPVNSSQCSVST